MAIAVARAPLQHHFLDGAKNLVDIFFGGEGQKGVQGLENAVLSPLTQFTNPSALRSLRSVAEGLADPQHRTPVLDQSNLGNKLWAFSPAYIGYDKPALNSLGEPISKDAFDSLTDRWIHSATVTHPILTPLTEHGLFLPKPNKSTPIITDASGTLMHVSDLGDDAWRQFVQARGDFLKQVLTPTMVQELIKMPQYEAQSYLLGPSIGAAANRYAIATLENQIYNGQLKVNKKPVVFSIKHKSNVTG